MSHNKYEYNRRYRDKNKVKLAIQLKEWRKNNPKKSNELHRRNNYIFKYGLTPEQIEKLLEDQNNLCAICNKEITLGGKGGAKLDHCHKTNIIRGVLCSNCNIGLGQFLDNTEILENAISYLYIHRMRYNIYLKNKEGEGEIGIS